MTVNCIIDNTEATIEFDSLKECAQTVQGQEHCHVQGAQWIHTQSRDWEEAEIIRVPGRVLSQDEDPSPR